MAEYENDLDKTMRTNRYFGGHIGDSWTIGDITIVQITKPENGYTIFLDGTSMSYHAATLDVALAHALAIKYDGRNTQAGHFFAKMVGMPE